MRQLTLSAPVRAPSEFTLARVRTYFQERSNGANAVELRLRAPLHAIVGDVSIDKPVTAEVRYVPSDDDAGAVGISWFAPGTSAFPSFVGTFTVCAEGNADCRLALNGSYTAPGGIAGAAFDAVLGNRIARATIEDLLHQLATAVETNYQTRVAM